MIKLYHWIGYKNYRKENNNIVVTDMSENEPRSVPNPVVTFEQAFMHYREYSITFEFIFVLYFIFLSL